MEVRNEKQTSQYEPYSSVIRLCFLNMCRTRGGKPKKSRWSLSLEPRKRFPNVSSNVVSGCWRLSDGTCVKSAAVFIFRPCRCNDITTKIIPDTRLLVCEPLVCLDYLGKRNFHQRNLG